MARIKIRYWAAAKQAAGTDEETVNADTLAAAIAIMIASHAGGDGRFAAVLARSSFLLDGQQPGNQAAESIALRDQQILEVLPPFAGG
jgi:molybdopterin synthase sulfur carrier subunit